MMTRMASMVVFLGLVAQSYGDCEDPQCQQKIQALLKELEETKHKYADARDDTYVTAQAIVDVMGDVTQSLGASSLNLSSVVEATNLNISVGDVDVSKVTEAVSSGYDAAKGAIMSAVGVAQGLHDEHLLPHANEYYSATAPHVEAVQKAYYDQIHPHVSKHFTALHAAVGQTGTGLRNKLKTLFEEATLSAATALEGTPSTTLTKLYEPREIQILGYKKVFTHGFLDVALFFVQLIANLYVGMLVLWQVGKILVWKCGLGMKLAKFGVKTSFGLTKTTASLSFSVFFFLLSTVFWVFTFCLFNLLGVSLMHGIEKNAQLGLDANMRMMIGMVIGTTFFGLIYVCCCCKRRAATAGKDKHKNGSNGKTNGTHAAKPKTEPAKKDEKHAKPPAKKPHGKK